MAYSTTTKGFRKPAMTDQYDAQTIDLFNTDRLNELLVALDSLIGSKSILDTTELTTDEKANIYATLFALYNKAVTDVTIGNRAINQAQALPGTPATAAVLTTVLSWLGHRFKDVLGTTNWNDAMPKIGADDATLTKIAALLNQEVKTTSAVTFASVTATDIYGTNYNDLAEWYPRIQGDEPTRPGEVIVYDPKRGGYTRSGEVASNLAVGVHSEHPGFTLGGEAMECMRDNIIKHIPVALAGRVSVLIEGYASPGCLVVSSIGGYGRTIEYSRRHDYIGCIIGKLLHPIQEDLWMMQVMLG